MSAIMCTGYTRTDNSICSTPRPQHHHLNHTPCTKRCDMHLTLHATTLRHKLPQHMMAHAATQQMLAHQHITQHMLCSHSTCCHTAHAATTTQHTVHAMLGGQAHPCTQSSIYNVTTSLNIILTHGQTCTHACSLWHPARCTSVILGSSVCQMPCLYGSVGGQKPQGNGQYNSSGRDRPST